MFLKRTIPEKGSAMGARGLAAVNLAALPAPADIWFEVGMVQGWSSVWSGQ